MIVYLSFEMVKSIWVFLSVLIIINGSLINFDLDSIKSVFDLVLRFRSINDFNAICYSIEFDILIEMKYYS